MSANTQPVFSKLFIILSDYNRCANSLGPEKPHIRVVFRFLGHAWDLGGPKIAPCGRLPQPFGASDPIRRAPKPPVPAKTMPGELRRLPMACVLPVWPTCIIVKDMPVFSADQNSVPRGFKLPGLQQK